MNQLKLAYEIARAEIGVQEIAGVKHNERILQYHQATTLKAEADEVPWCSAFVNWCVIIAGLCMSPLRYRIILKENGFDDVTVDALFSQASEKYQSVYKGIECDEDLDDSPLMVPTFSALARHWLSWGEETRTPSEGDLVIFSRGSGFQGHVGFFVKRDPLTVTVLGGNQNDQVKESRYMRARVLGYRTIKT